jgi:DNA-binding LytR/AlgR family response regulator
VPNKIGQTLMNYPYIIIDDDQESVLKTKAIADGFSELVFVASANNYSDGLNLILEYSPKLIFLEIDPTDKTSNLSLALINELYRYLKVIPKVIITTASKDLAFESIQYEVADYMIKPVKRIDFIKSILKIKKSIGEDEVIVIQKPVFNEPQELIVEQSQSPKVNQEPKVKEIPVLEETKELLEEQPQSLDDAQEPITEKISALEETSALKEEQEQSPDENLELTEEQASEINDENEPTEEETPVFNETLEVLAEPIPEIIIQQVTPIVEQPLILCIKSYGDYRYIDANDICYFQADNNSTDIHLNNGEMVTAFKTLKHFEGILSSPFTRIHNSYIVNCDYISRIHTGNAVCYIKNTTTKIPFSKSYKENVDLIISEFANGNYLEI